MSGWVSGCPSEPPAPKKPSNRITIRSYHPQKATGRLVLDPLCPLVKGNPGWCRTSWLLFLVLGFKPPTRKQRLGVKNTRYPPKSTGLGRLKKWRPWPKTWGSKGQKAFLTQKNCGHSSGKQSCKAMTARYGAADLQWRGIPGHSGEEGDHQAIFIVLLRFQSFWYVFIHF